MSNNGRVTARQILGQEPTATPIPPGAQWCSQLILPTGGVFIFDENVTSTLTASVTFKLPCNSSATIISPDSTDNSTLSGSKDPFYASTSPNIFALATATVISYILVILIFITPRTFVGGSGSSGGRFLTRRGLISGSSSIIGVGRRPLLQKIATITVAVSLTIATADTFKVAEEQYKDGYMDSSYLVHKVVNSLEIRIVRVISDTFLWLAQVQTLIRLFPRHKEKVTIKWLGFALVSADTVFSILDSVISDGTSSRQARSFKDAIPAMNYLFELAISLIYASCVVYYSMSKRRFAFYHRKMRNICLVALVSLMSVLIPVVFFVLDVAKPDVAGWGEYIRWVGAAAASVVVWEWVERIEALERDERKDGILGREVFDGDEMLDENVSEDTNRHGRGGRSGGDGAKSKSKGLGSLGDKYRLMRERIPMVTIRKGKNTNEGTTKQTIATTTAQSTQASATQEVLPRTVTSPPSRSDTNSAASTVYAIRYHNFTSPSPAIPEGIPEPESPVVPEVPKEVTDSSTEAASSPEEKENMAQGPKEGRKAEMQNPSAASQIWRSVANPFKRRRAEPPAEIADAQIASGMRRSPIDRTINLRDRVGAFAKSQKERFSGRGSMDPNELPVMVIPVPRLNERTWSPNDVRDDVQADSNKPTSETSNPPHDANEHNYDGDSGIPTNVVIIPAPTPGRTWSPGDAYTTENNESNQPTYNVPPGRERATPPQQNSNMNANVHTSRGSLTISESNARAQAQSQSQMVAPGSHRSAYSRPTSSSPLAVRSRSASGPSELANTGDIQSGHLVSASLGTLQSDHPRSVSTAQREGATSSSSDHRDAGAANS